MARSKLTQIWEKENKKKNKKKTQRKVYKITYWNVYFITKKWLTIKSLNAYEQNLQKTSNCIYTIFVAKGIFEKDNHYVS